MQVGAGASRFVFAFAHPRRIAARGAHGELEGVVPVQGGQDGESLGVKAEVEDVADVVFVVGDQDLAQGTILSFGDGGCSPGFRPAGANS